MGSRQGLQPPMQRTLRPSMRLPRQPGTGQVGHLLALPSLHQCVAWSSAPDTSEPGPDMASVQKPRERRSTRSSLSQAGRSIRQ